MSKPSQSVIACARIAATQISEARTTIELKEDRYRWDQPNRRFCLLEPDSLFDDAITRLQIQQFRVKKGWSLIFTVQNEDPIELGVVDVWSRNGLLD